MESEYKPDQSRQPKATSFHQQKVHGWQPIITTKTLFIPFIILGLFFIISGSLLIHFSSQVNELYYDYTYCVNENNVTCSDILQKNNLTYKYGSCKCVLNITLNVDFKGQVFMYYGLSNFYQNHRRYVSSRDDSQLKGNLVTDPASTCDPFRFSNKTSKTVYAPCGLIANSLFNDTYTLNYVSTNYSIPLQVPWTSKGIAWHTEVDSRYGRPASWNNTAKPPNWPQSEQIRSNNTGYSGDEELIVWMRTAALPDFKKLHRIVQHDKVSTPTVFKDGLPKGDYQMIVDYAYPVVMHGGQKSITLTTANALGGRNPTMGIFVVALGTLYIALSICFIFINTFVAKRQLSEVLRIAAEFETGDLNQGPSNLNHYSGDRRPTGDNGEVPATGYRYRNQGVTSSHNLGYSDPV